MPSTEGLPIHYDFYEPGGRGEKPLPVILFLHGFKGFKDWGAFPDACTELCADGFAVAAINFSLNGVGESMTEFNQLDLFSRETLTQDLEDVGSVIAAIQAGEIGSAQTNINMETMGVLGHSRGGHTAVVAAAENPEISCLVTWSAVANYNDHWNEEMISDWETEGVTEIKNGRTGQMMPVKDVVYKDAQENANRLMASERIKELDIPALFVHAKGDEGVPFSEADRLYHNCPAEDKEIKLIPDSGHTFDTSHPFEEEGFPEAFEQALNTTVEWFQYHLQ